MLEFAESLPDLESTIVLCRPSANIKTANSYQIVSRDTWSVDSLIQEIRSLAEGHGNLFYFFGDTPLLDRSMAAEMYEKHIKYYAQYSFADGYPIGLSIEIVSAEILPVIATLAEDDHAPPQRDSLFTVIQKDINAFDIETDIAARDQRLLRVTLAADSRRNFAILQKVVDAGGTDARTVIDVLDAKPRLLRSQPAFFYVQIVDGCPQTCSYCPWPDIGGDILFRRNEMPVDRFTQLLGKIRDFTDDATVGISMWGEPAVHSDIPAVIHSMLEYPTLSLTIETSGIGWHESVFDEIDKELSKRITWIVSIDALDQNLYKTYRGDGYDEAGFKKYCRPG